MCQRIQHVILSIAVSDVEPFQSNLDKSCLRDSWLSCGLSCSSFCKVTILGVCVSVWCMLVNVGLRHRVPEV